MMPQKTETCIALISGGIDSVTLLYWLTRHGETPRVLVFDYGQQESRELGFAKDHALKLKLAWECVNLRFLPQAQYDEGDGANTYIPTRNLVFLSIAASMAEGIGIHRLYCGFHYIKDMFWDSTPQFVSSLNRLLRLNNRHKVIVDSPFESWAKTEIVDWGVSNGVDYAKTWACYKNEELACGECAGCRARLKTFRALGITDPLRYV